MIGYKRGDIVLVPFPFTDLSTIKQRPALIISSNGFNRNHEDVIIVALTSNRASAAKGHNYLIDGTEQLRAGLPKEGVALVGKIITIDQRLIRRVLGSLSPRTVTEIARRVGKIISVS